MLTGGVWDNNVQFPQTVELIMYIALWVIAAAGLGFVLLRGRAAGFNMRWTTQDVLVLAVMGVLLEVYDNLIGDQFITPAIRAVTGPANVFVHNLAPNDIPYMFLLMVGIAIIRKPGVATALVFLNFLLMQLLYGGDKSTPLWWEYGIFQGLLVDIYIVARGKRIFEKANGRAIVDGLIMGAVRAFPAVAISSALLGPFLLSNVTTVGDIVSNSVLNLIGNGLAAGLLAPVAIRVAQSVGQNATIEPPSDTTTPVVPVTTDAASPMQAGEGA